MSNTKTTDYKTTTDYKIMAIKALPINKVSTLEDTKKIMAILDYDSKKSNQFPQSFYKTKK